MKSRRESKYFKCMKKEVISKFFICVALVLPVLSTSALVLDWSGSYELELNILQKGDFEQWGSSEVFHNLRLKPDIKVFDEVRVRSWFQLAHQVDSASQFGKFHPQDGNHFGLLNKNAVFSPLMAVRDLYLEVAHDFGLFQMGWKPHHFGLGMYYNDSSMPFSPFYNKEGARGFVSWRGFVGSYYVQPMIHYLDEFLFNFFIQAGFGGEQYGADVLYKTSPQGVTDGDSQSLKSPSYFGFYGYYKMEKLSIQAEAGGNLHSALYGGVVDIDWQTPLKWLDLGLDLGGAMADEGDAFYFDPSFSSFLSFLIEEYETSQLKADPSLKEYPFYSFHSAVYIAPSASFSILDSLSLRSVFSMHLSYLEVDVLLYHAELGLQYELAENIVWNTGVGVLFPAGEHWHIGVISQAAITF